MNKARFNILHKYSIIINRIKYRILQSKDPSYVCRKCDRYNRSHCNIDKTTCINTIGRCGYLKRINPKK